MLIISIDDLHNVDINADKQNTIIDFIDTHGSTYRIELSTNNAQLVLSELQYQLSKV